MKRVASTIMAVAFLFALNTNAQEGKKAAKAKAKTEKSCSTAEKKACATTAAGEKKGSCCAHK